MKWAAVLFLSVVSVAQSTTPNLGMSWPAHGSPNWDVQVVQNSVIVDNVFGIPNCAFVGWDSVNKKLICSSTSSGFVVTSPSADQTITGSHQLINRGTDQTGPALSGFDAKIQAAAVDPSSGSVAVSGQDLVNLGVGVQGISQGLAARGIFGLVSDTQSTVTSSPSGGTFISYLTTTGNNSGTPAGTVGTSVVIPSVGTTIASGWGVQGNAFNQGAGTVSILSGFSATANANSGGGTVTSNYGYDAPQSFVASLVGTTNAAFHSKDMGAGASNYGILLEGVTHNDLGSGVTKVGGLLASGLSASLPLCTDGSKNLTTTGCTNLQGVPEATQATSYAIASTDRFTRILANSGSAVAWTLAQAGTAGFAANFAFTAANAGAGTLTITATTSTFSCVPAASCSGSVLTLTTGQWAFIYSDNTNYFASVYAPAAQAAQYAKWLACDGKGLGDGLNAIPAGTYLESTCRNITGVTVTITGIQCLTDNNGTSTLNAAGNTLGALLTGAVTCTTSYAAGTQSANVALTANDYIKFTFVADGTSKQTDWIVTGTF